jgi:hypothetical protein
MIKTIYKFQHFPFHTVRSSRYFPYFRSLQWNSIFILPFNLFTQKRGGLTSSYNGMKHNPKGANLNQLPYFWNSNSNFSLPVRSLNQKRGLFSSNNNWMEHKNKKPLSSDKKSPVSKDTHHLKNTNSETKISIFANFWLKIKNYYRRTLIGIKKGYSVNNLPPETEKLLSNI